MASAKWVPLGALRPLGTRPGETPTRRLIDAAHPRLRSYPAPGFAMILWIFPLISCVGVLLAGFVAVQARQHRSTPDLALIPVGTPEVREAARPRFGPPGPQGCR